MTSILFADLVGFTPLSESWDPEDIRELLAQYFERCRRIITRYQGTVEKFIGDAVMAVWGAPVAHEDDAERAVRAGLELVSMIGGLGDDLAAPGLSLRVGVVTGEVAVTIGATDQGLVSGDAVNTAARVQTKAEPGEVWVDETTRSLSAAAITFAAAGSHVLKGKSEPLRLWRAATVVSRGGDRTPMDGIEAPLVGRAHELQLLKELFHATQDSGRPQLVVVDGEAGVGKSRLVRELEQYLDGFSPAIQWHRGRCLSYGAGVAFWALTEAVRGHLGVLENDDPRVIRDHLEAALSRVVPDADERRWLRPRLAALIGATEPGALDHAAEDLFSAWTVFFERVGSGGDPVVLVIEDAQYADEGLLNFLDQLLTAARTAIYVLVLARPALLDRRPDLGRRRTTVVRLHPLDQPAMSQLVAGLVADLPRTTQVELVTRAEGIPLFAVETIRALVDQGVLVIDEDGQRTLADAAVVDLASVGAPASLQALVAARLDALTDDERWVIEAASVLGLSFTRDGVAAIVGPTDFALEPILDSLQRKELVALNSDPFSAERGQYRFGQLIVRQVAYATQSRADRRMRHLAAAQYLSSQPEIADQLASVIAQHLLDAVDAAPARDSDSPAHAARAVDLLERGARRALSVGSPAQAEQLLAIAFDRENDPGRQADLQLAIAQAALDAGHYHAAIERARDIADWFDDQGRPIHAGRAAAIEGRARTVLHDHRGAIEVTEPRWHALEHVPGAEAARLQLAIVLGLAYLFSGQHDSAGYADQVIILAEATGDYDALAHGHLHRANRYRLYSAPLTAIALAESGRAIAEQHDIPARLAQALFHLNSLNTNRDLPAALRFGQEATSAAHRSGNSEMIGFSQLNYLTALWTAGRLTEASGLLVDARERGIAASNAVQRHTVEAWLCEAMGRPQPPPLTVNSLGVEGTDDLNPLVFKLNLALMNALAADDPVTAARLAEQSIDPLLAICGIEDDFMHLWPSLVRAALAAHDLGLAQRLLGPVASAAPVVVPPIVAAEYLWLGGLVAAARADDASEVESALRGGIDALDAFGAVIHRVRAEEDLARWLVGQGRTAEAHPLVDKVRQTYSEIGADGWRARLGTWSGDVRDGRS